MQRLAVPADERNRVAERSRRGDRPIGDNARGWAAVIRRTARVRLDRRN